MYVISIDVTGKILTEKGLNNYTYFMAFVVGGSLIVSIDLSNNAALIY